MSDKMKETKKEKPKKLLYATDEEVRRILEKNLEKDKELLIKLSKM